MERKKYLGFIELTRLEPRTLDLIFVGLQDEGGICWLLRMGFEVKKGNVEGEATDRGQ